MGDNPGYIDIHSHFLPGLDDGPENLDQCLETAMRYNNIGVDRVIATPHYIPGTKWAASAEQIEKNIEETRQQLVNANINLTILPGMEIALTEALCRNFDTEKLLPVDSQRVFLVELSLNATNEDPVFKGLQRLLSHEGIKFILAHPERYLLFQKEPEWLHYLIGQGMLIQINIGSILGLGGKKVQKTSFSLLRSGMVHFLATDSHARGKRTVPDTKQMQQLTSLIGEETLRHGFKENPENLLRGDQIQPLQAEGISINTGSFFPVKTGIAESFRRIFGGN